MKKRHGQFYDFYRSFSYLFRAPHKSFITEVHLKRYMINRKVAWAASRIFQIIIMGRLVENGIANDIEHQYRGLVRIASPHFHLILLVFVNLVLDISSRQNNPEHLGLLKKLLNRM